MTQRIAVIGAGVGGLSAAIDLAAGGARVDVYEAMSSPGGKAGSVRIDGVSIDTGPSVLTLPDTFDALFQRAGTRLTDELSLRRLDPGFRYRWTDGTHLDVHHDPAHTIASVHTALGAGAADDLARFLQYAGEIWAAAAPSFVYGPAPTAHSLLSHGWQALRLVRAIDPLSRMRTAIARRVRDERLQWLLWRYATYNGSDPRRAPATLNCIAHVELALGGWGVQGGIQSLTAAMVRVAQRLGVTIHCDRPVDGIGLDAGRATHLRLRDGRQVRADAIVANADASHVRDTLLPTSQRGALPQSGTPSMSGWTGILRTRRRHGAEARPPHEVLFPDDYSQEFRDIFDHNRPPSAPTVYICAQEACHGVRGWASEEPVFVMANAPAESPEGPRPDAHWRALQRRITTRLRSASLANTSDEFVWTRTPTDLARIFPGSRGALYGFASNTVSAAFRRPANRVARVPGLYLSSGSAHPGGGLPMAALSGRAAAAAIAADSGQQHVTAPQHSEVA